MFFSKNQNEQFKRKDDMKVVELYFCFLILTFDIAESEKKNISDPVELKESSFEDFVFMVSKPHEGQTWVS